MKLLKIARTVFLFLFIAAMVPAVVIMINDLPKIKKVRAGIDQKTEERNRLQADLHETNLKARGFLESLSEIPDSIRLADAAAIKARSDSQKKILYNLEKAEAEVSRLLKKDRRERSALYAHLKRRLAVFAGGGLFFLAGFVIVTLRLRFRA